MLCTCPDRDLDQFASSTWLTDSRNDSHLDVIITRVYPEPSQHHTKILPYVPTIRCRSSPPECLWLHISRVLLNSSPIHLKPWQVPWGSPSCFSFTSHALEFCAHVLTSFSPAFSTCTFPSLKLPPFFFMWHCLIPVLSFLHWDVTIRWYLFAVMFLHCVCNPSVFTKRAPKFLVLPLHPMYCPGSAVSFSFTSTSKTPLLLSLFLSFVL